MPVQLWLQPGCLSSRHRAPAARGTARQAAGCRRLCSCTACTAAAAAAASASSSSLAYSESQAASRSRRCPCTARAAAAAASPSASGPAVSVQQQVQAASRSRSSPCTARAAASPSASGPAVSVQQQVEPGTAAAAAAARRRLWFLAIKPPMYNVALIPILVASACAYAATGVWNNALTGQLVLGAFCIIAWLNTSNDVFDSEMNVDGDKPESIVNLTGNRAGCFWVANAFLVTGTGLLLSVMRASGDLAPVGILAAAVALGYMYQGPPFRLSYKGLGEPITFFTFGPLAMTAFFRTQVQPVFAVLLTCQIATAAVSNVAQARLAACSALIGLTTAAILLCSHFHSIDTDKAAKKMSPLVRLGTPQRGALVLRWLTRSVYGIAAACTALQILPLACVVLLPLTYLPARQMLRFATENASMPPALRPLKLYATKWHSVFGFALALAVASPRLLRTLL